MVTASGFASAIAGERGADSSRAGATPRGTAWSSCDGDGAASAAEEPTQAAGFDPELRWFQSG